MKKCYNIVMPTSFHRGIPSRISKALNTTPVKKNFLSGFFGSSKKSSAVSTKPSSIKVKELMASSFGKGFVPKKAMDEIRLAAQAINGGRNDYVDSNGDIQRLTPEMRVFAKTIEARKKNISASEQEKNIKGLVDIATGQGIKFASGINIGRRDEMAGRIQKQYEKKFSTHEDVPVEKHTPLPTNQIQKRHGHLNTLYSPGQPVSISPSPRGVSPTLQSVTPVASPTSHSAGIGNISGQIGFGGSPTAPQHATEKSDAGIASPLVRVSGHDPSITTGSVPQISNESTTPTTEPPTLPKIPEPTIPEVSEPPDRLSDPFGGVE